MAYDYTPLRAFAGINRAFDEASLNDGELADSMNFLFRRREASTRPGLKTIGITGFTGTCVFAKSFVGIGSTPLTLLISNNGKLYSLSSANTATEITGAGTTFDATGVYNATMVNRVILIGNNTGGLIRWDPAGVTYTIIADAPYRFVTRHTARALAAYRLSGGGAGNAITIAWSDEGDETVWTTAGASTAGSSILTDMSGDITGLSTLHNLVQIARNNGFHIGTPTGTAFPAFIFAPWAHEGPGVLYPETMANDNNISFFVADDDVYTFDLQQIAPIGTQVRDVLIPLLKSGVKYSGFISRNAKDKVRLTYHLTPLAQAQAPHFIYDNLEQTWSVCQYDDTDLQVGFQRYPLASGGVSFINSTPALRIWDEETPLDGRAWLDFPTRFIGNLSKDYRVSAVLARYRNLGNLDGVRVGINGQLATIDVEGSSKRKIGSGAVPGTNRWQRAWFRCEVVGQGFMARIEVDPGSRFTTNYVELRSQEAGEFKGELL